MNGTRSMRLAIALALVAVVLAANGCGGGGTTVSATLKDFSIGLSSTEISSGRVTFDIRNAGPSEHEFVVVKTADASNSLPTKQEEGVQVVDEDAQGLEAVDEAEDIADGATPTLEVSLGPGHYVVFCNILSHYIAGMRASFTVS